MEMELEADLGIDSIKRVEILSALQERLPGLPEVDASEIPTLQTLGQVLEFVEEQAGRGGNGGGRRSGRNERSDAAEAPQPGSWPGGRSNGAGATQTQARIERALVREVLTEVGETTSLLAGLEPDSTVAVVDGGSGLARPLIDRLRGADQKMVEATAGAVPEDAAAAIFLGGLAPVETPEQAIAVNRQAFEVARRVAPRLTKSGGLFVTVQDTGGDFGLSGRAGDRAWLCGLSALAKTGALEWPEARVKAIDLERGERSAEELAEALAREITAGGRELEVGLHADGTRATLESEVSPPVDHGEPVVDRDSVLVVSGGARGVTAATLLELARRFQPRLVLLGRTPIDVEEPRVCQGINDDAGLKRALLSKAQADGVNVSPAEVGAQVARILAGREARETLELLDAAGAGARYFALDVRDRQALDKALSDVRQEWGPITGVIHGAGVLADKTIADKTSDQFDRVFDTKVEGLRALLQATADDPLRLICVFSSVAARFGNVGQSDYAMANEIVGRVAAAEARRRDGACLVRAIDWGPWDGGMVTPALRGYFKGLGVPLIPLETGARMLMDELLLDGAGPGGVEVVIGGAPPTDKLHATRAGGRAGATVLG
jgi:NAD(P)-dependent dehydrogenase (short-subunit alcohol dehydrogenase family)